MQFGKVLTCGMGTALPSQCTNTVHQAQQQLLKKEQEHIQGIDWECVIFHTTSSTEYRLPSPPSIFPPPPPPLSLPQVSSTTQDTTLENSNESLPGPPSQNILESLPPRADTVPTVPMIPDLVLKEGKSYDVCISHLRPHPPSFTANWWTTPCSSTN